MSSTCDMNKIRVGNGFDVHRFAPGRELFLGGIRIDYPLGLLGHSDADVLIHSIIDSFLGPSNLGDIGRLFPDKDPAYKNISSITLLGEVYSLMKHNGITIINTDSVIVCEEPKIAPQIERMKECICGALQNDVTPDAVSIKGKTSEKLGFTGRGEGIAVYTVSLVHLK